MKKGIVVYGFPCIGKSTLCDSPNNNGRFLDLESSNYQWLDNAETKDLSVEAKKGREREREREILIGQKIMHMQ